MKFGNLAGAVLIAVLLFCGTSVKAIVGGQTDDFEDGGLENWGNGGNAPAVLNITTGGPAGANDNFMEVTANGTIPGPFLTVFNRSQWLGDYIGSGITAIEMDLENLGETDLSIRLAFKSMTGSTSPGYLSESFALSAESGWQHAVFLINPGDLVTVGTPSSFETFFSNNFQETRIINEIDSTSLNGEAIAGQLGVDNIHAIAAVPEPGGAVVAVMLFGYLVSRRRTRS